MKKFLVSTMLALTTLSMVVEASARPMGGGRSIGRQSHSVQQMRTPAPAPVQRQQAAPAAPRPAPAAIPPARPSMWKGILGGALLGLGLGALFSHLGIGGAMASALSSILMIALLAMAAMFIWRMFRRKDTPANSAFQGFNNPVAAGATPEIGSGLQQAYQPEAARANAYQPLQEPGSGVSLDKPGSVPHVAWNVPPGFDTDGFLREAKTMFIRLQADWDKGDVADLQRFTTPEVFAELKMQIQERGASADFTDVVSLDAQLLGIERTDTEYLASVQFNGMIRTAPNAPAEPLVEVWNLAKPVAGNGGWVLAGIQQLS